VKANRFQVKSVAFRRPLADGAFETSRLTSTPGTWTQKPVRRASLLSTLSLVEVAGTYDGTMQPVRLYGTEVP
jgi:hypothetical protein